MGEIKMAMRKTVNNFICPYCGERVTAQEVRDGRGVEKIDADHRGDMFHNIPDAINRHHAKCEKEAMEE